MTDPALCTVVSKNHFSYARALAESFRAHHPDAPIFVLLVDRLDGSISPKQEPFELIEIAELDIPNLPRFCFQYSVIELNCAAKSFFVRHLLERRGVERLVYLDSDMLVLRPLAELRELLDHHSVVLTPHLIRDVDDDGRKPGERHVLESGIYNAGFLAVRNDPSALRAVTWLSRRVYTQCVADPSLGLFVDQRWLDLIPGMFDDVHILRHPGYNVGHWALPHRRVERHGDEYLVDGRPLALFHFSGLDLNRLDRISQHQDRFTLDDVPQLRPLFERYRAGVMAAGHAETHQSPYAFARFSNGARIPAEARRMYWELGDRVDRFGDPFDTDHPGSFWEWLNQEVRRGSEISRLWQRVYAARPDVQNAWPDLFGQHRLEFLDWAGRQGRMELGVDEAFGPARHLATQARDEPSNASASLPGVNVIGHALSEKGMGEALRATVRSLTAIGAPHVVVDFTDNLSANTDRTPLEFAAHNPHPINIIHINADGIPAVIGAFGAKFLHGKFNIGYWVWELSELPPAFHGSFAHLDEVWVPSSFCLEAVAQVSPVPVVKIPYALPAAGLPTKAVGRDHFGLPAGSFVFLFIFDVHSITARKNPSALVRAFRAAFPRETDVRLVLKLVHGTREVYAELGEALKDPRVTVIDRIFEREEINSLIEACDCYVSLHRSEGFGMTVAEAMALGKPVIATGYSGPVDFMTPHNSFLVDYELVELERDYVPYPRGSVWAEPNVDHAARLMRLVYNDREQAARVGERASRDIWRYLSADAIAARIAARLELIAHRLPKPVPTRPFGLRLGSWLARKQLLAASRLPGGIRRTLRTLTRFRPGTD